MVTSVPPLGLRRNILEKVLGNNHEAIRQFELLFAIVNGAATNTDIVTPTETGTALSSAQAALALIDVLSAAVEGLATAPENVSIFPADDVAPVGQPAGFGPQIQDEVPTAGFNITVTSLGVDVWLLLRPAGTLATGTVTLPPAAQCNDGQVVQVTSTQIITALTVDGNGATVSGAPLTIGADGTFSLKYRQPLATWYRIV
jgi:hypothetical protein